MTSSDFEERRLFWENNPLFCGAGGLAWEYRRAVGVSVACECCEELECGCWCEATTRLFDLRVAEKAFFAAERAHKEWFDAHRRPQIEAEDAEWRREEQRERRKWRRFRRESRKRWASLFKLKEEAKHARKGGKMDDNDKENKRPTFGECRFLSRKEAEDHGVWNWSPNGSEKEE